METYKDEQIITGNAFRMVTEDLFNLRRMCEAMLEAHEREDVMDLNQMLELLRMLI